MKSIRFSTVTALDITRLQPLLNADIKHSHIHIIDMPYRLTSTWQDEGCEIGLWEDGDQLLAWAVYQPAWWNTDYVIHPAMRGTSLEKDVLSWSQTEMIRYAKRTGETFYGSIEFFEDTPNAKQTIGHLEALGYEKFDWTTRRFEIDLQRKLPNPQLPAGFAIRPLRGQSEVETYVNLHRAAFGSEKMTVPWRIRSLEHPAYRPEIDLVIIDPEGNLAGFCVCWLLQNMGQIEPLGVHPDYQGLGLGRALELTALHTLRKHGASAVHIDHVSLNEKAISLSLQTGFKQINNAVRYFVNADANA